MEISRSSETLAQKSSASPRAWLRTLSYTTAIVAASLLAEKGIAQGGEKPNKASTKSEMQDIPEKKFPNGVVQPTFKKPTPPIVQQVIEAVNRLKPKMESDNFFEREKASADARKFIDVVSGSYNGLQYPAYKAMLMNPRDPDSYESSWRREAAFRDLHRKSEPTRVMLETRGTALEAFERLSQSIAVELYTTMNQEEFERKLAEVEFYPHQNSFGEIAQRIATITGTKPVHGNKSAGSICFESNPDNANIILDPKKLFVASYMPPKEKLPPRLCIVSDPQIALLEITNAYESSGPYTDACLVEIQPFISPEIATDFLRKKETYVSQKTSGTRTSIPLAVQYLSNPYFIEVPIASAEEIKPGLVHPWRAYPENDGSIQVKRSIHRQQPADTPHTTFQMLGRRDEYLPTTLSRCGIERDRTERDTAILFQLQPPSQVPVKLVVRTYSPVVTNENFTFEISQ